MKTKINFVLNSKSICTEVDPSLSLLDFLREDQGLTGTKEGCGEGNCGCCTVLIDGTPFNSCLVLMPKVEGKEVTTIEGLSGENGELHPIQEAFIEHGAFQCGFCTPGMILSVKHILDQNPMPSEEEIKVGLSGNLCRCTGYQKIIETVRSLSKKEE